MYNLMQRKTGFDQNLSFDHLTNNESLLNAKKFYELTFGYELNSVPESLSSHPAFLTVDSRE